MPRPILIGSATITVAVIIFNTTVAATSRGGDQITVNGPDVVSWFAGGPNGLDMTLYG